MKKKKQEKTKKKEPKQHLIDEVSKNENDQVNDTESRFGGMKIGNFKKNIGCGS